MNQRRILSITLALVIVSRISAANPIDAKPIKAFILAGQSNMVGWGDSTKLPDDLRRGNDRVLVFEDGKWQVLRPHQPVIALQRRVGLTEHSFGPELSFAHALAKARPQDTIGIIKLAFGGASVLAWKPDWSKKDADRVKQGNWGSLYQKLLEKVNQARASKNVEIAGMLWLQGGGDMKDVDVAREYLANLKSLVAAIRRDTGLAQLPFVYGSARSRDPGFEVADDLSHFEPRLVSGIYPAAQWVLKAQFDAQREIPHSHLVIFRDIEKHPQNIHYSTEGQLVVGRMFAAAYLEKFRR